MKTQNIILVITIFYLGSLFSQNPNDAKTLVNEGIIYHDKGDFEGAIKCYDKALELDKDNLLALGEKAFSLNSLGKNNECIQICKLAIEKHKGEKELKNVYVSYADALDAQKKTEAALQIYDIGIKSFPFYYQLYFNKGVTLAKLKKSEEALMCFQRSAVYNPRNAASHDAIARTLYVKNNSIAALLAFCRFFTLENESARGKKNLEYVRKILKADIQKALNDSMNNNTSKENNFSSVSLILSTEIVLDSDKKNIKKTEVENFIRKFDKIYSALKETKNNNSGFYWDYYVPYFIELKDKGFIEIFANLVFYVSEDKSAQKWIKAHEEEVKRFLEWSKAYGWFNK